MDQYLNYEFISTHLSLILGILFGVIVLLYFIDGLIKGRRRSIYKWLTTIILYTVLIIFADKIIDFAINFNLSKVGVSIEGGETIKEVIDAKLNLGENANQVAVNFASIAIRYLLFTFISFIIGIPYRIICWLIFIIFFKKRKKKVKEEYVDEKSGETKYRDIVKRPKKHSFGGGLVNGLRGAVLFALFVVILFNGPIGIIPNGLLNNENNETESSENLDGENVVNKFSDILEDENVQKALTIIYNYKSTPFYSLGELGGNTSINDLVNKAVWSVNINDTKVDVRADLKSISSVAPLVLDLIDSDFNDPFKIDYTKVGTVIDALSTTKTIPAILPIALEMAKESDEIVNGLSEYGLSVDDLSTVDLNNDLSKLSNVLNNVDSLVKNIRFVENEENLNTVEYIDLNSIDMNKLKDTVSLITSLSVVNVASKALVYYANNNEKVKEYVDELEADLNTIIFEDELVNIVDIMDKVIKTGINSISYIKDNLVDYINNLDFGNNDINNGAVGNVLSSIFASAFIDSIFPKLMENIIYPYIPEDYQSLFDFSKFSDSLAWESELQAIISIAKELKGNNGQILIKDGEKTNINFDLIENLSAKSILNSNIISDAIVNLLVDQDSIIYKNASDYIQYPDNYKNASYSGWMSKTIYKYQAKEDIVLNNKTINKFNTISVEEFENLSDENKDKFNPIYHVTDGEIYHLINGIMSVKNDIQIKDLLNGNMNNLLTAELIENIATNKSGNNSLDNLLKSDIIRCSFTKVINKYGSEYVVIPVSATTSETINGVETNIIKTDEYKTILTALVKMDIISTVYTANSTNAELNINKGDKISKEEYDLLSEQAKGYYNSSINVEISSKTISDIDKLNEEGISKLDYILGNSEKNIKSSEILKATMSKYILDMDDSIVVPTECINDDGNVKIIKDNELKNLLTGIAKLDIINGEDINVDISLLNTLNDKVDENNTKLDYVLRSDILVATVSKYLFDADDTIVIPNTTYSVKQSYKKTGNIDSKVLNTTELKNLVDVIINLDIINGEDINVDINVVNKLKGIENNSLILKATITKYILDNSDTLSIPTNTYYLEGDKNVITDSEYNGLIDAIVDLEIIKNGEISADINLINKLKGVEINSLILKATITKYVMDSGSDIIIPSNAIYTSGGKTILTNTEYTNLINDLVDLGIVKDGNVNVNLDLINTISEKDIDLTNSLILYATVSNKIIEASEIIIPNEIIETNNSISYINSTEFNTFIDSVANIGLINSNGNVRDINDLSADILNNTNNQQDSISDSIILRATLSNTINSAISIPDDAKESGFSVTIITSNEISTLFNSLKLLEINNFNNTEVKLGQLFKINDNNKLDELFNSKIIHSNASKSILDGASIISNDIKVKTTSIRSANTNTGIKPISYATSKSININEYVYIYAFNQELEELRLNVAEIKALVNILEELSKDDLGNINYNSNDFNINSESFESIYKHPDVFTNLITDSILLTYSLDNLITNAIDNALDATLISYKTKLIDRLNDIKNIDISLYKNYSINEEYDYDTYYGLNDNQLYRLLVGLSEIEGKDLTTLAESESAVRAIDDSYILRVIFDNNPLISYYEVIDTINSGTNTYNIGDYINISTYVSVVSSNPVNATKVKSAVNYDITDTSGRPTFINNFVSTL